MDLDRHHARSRLATAFPLLVLLALGILAGLMWQRSTILQAEPPEADVTVADSSPFAAERQRMIQRDLRGRDIRDARVLDAMGRVPRHRFVPESFVDLAYADRPLPIGHEQTISQPYIVALMTQLARVDPKSRVLDIGTGSGYQAAVLSLLSKEVHSIEILEPLADEATKRLRTLGYRNVTVRHGDGYRGWDEKGPFDAIIVAAAPNHVPKPLIEQLAPGGRLVIPVGRYYQELLVIHKRADGSIQRESTLPVMFVPMTGEAREAAKEPAVGQGLP